MHRTTQTTLFVLVLRRLRPEFCCDNHTRTRRLWTGALNGLNSSRNWTTKYGKHIKPCVVCRAVTGAIFKSAFDTLTGVSRWDNIYTDRENTYNYLAPPAVGPYRVLANDRRTITIDCDRITGRFSADRCVYEPPLLDAPRARTDYTWDLAEKVTKSMQCAVERLLNHRIMEDGTTEFRIKWAEYDELT